MVVRLYEDCGESPFLGLSLLMVFLDYLLQNFDPSTSRAFDWTSARVVYVKLRVLFSFEGV